MISSNDNQIQLMEKMNTVGFEFPERHALIGLLQRQLEQVAVRINFEEPWGPGNRAAVRAVIVSGPSRAGKSDGVDQCLECLDPVTTVDGQVLMPRFDRISAPTVFTQAAMAREFLRGMGYPATRKMTSDIAWTKVEDRLPQARFTHMAVDEVQYSFSPSTLGRHSFQVEKIKAQGAFTRLLDHPIWPLPLVLIGLPAVADEYSHSDLTFIRERSDFLEIKAMSIDDKAEHGRLKRGITALCDQAEIGWTLHDCDYLFGRLIHAAGRARGLAIYLAKSAICEAVKQDSRDLQLSHFRDTYATKVGRLTAPNPFSAANWADVDLTELSVAPEINILSHMKKMHHAR